MSTKPFRLSSLSFSARSEHDGLQFKHFELTVNEPHPFDSTDCKSLVRLRWQSDRDGGFNRFYGLHVSLDYSVGFEGHIAGKTARLAKLTAKLDLHSSTTPDQVLATFAALGIVRKEHDGRLGRYITEDKKLDLVYDRYLDAYDRYGKPGQGCTVSAPARDADEARELLSEEFAKLIGGSSCGSSEYASRFLEWKAAGKLVKTDQYARAAQFISLDVLLNKPAFPVEAAAA